ncbi:MAG: type II secretion system GspH family protein [Calditerrivibrio sp.]|nr:type II secretion system GspH family protein [Calditerrivibrio sp.]
MLRGMTLLELIIVIFILSLIIGVSVYYYNKLSKKVSIENDTYNLYSLAIQARVLGFTEKENKIIRILGPDNTTAIMDNDSNITNGYILQLKLQNPFIPSSNGSNDIFRFDKNGFADYQGHIRAKEISDSAYDCVVISYGRIALGKYNNNSCNAK